jgi:ABC-type uncharacterized transport system involved in gliding motility auxiliary subunit
MRVLKNIIGPVGLALILVGGVMYAIFYTSGWKALLPLLVGFICTIASIIIHIRQSSTEASRRSARFSINAGASIVFFAAILIFMQTLSSRHSARFDTTSNRRFSLASQTVNILKSLDREIHFTCFFKETTSGKKELEDLLEEYRSTNGLVSYVFIDPDKDPVSARRYEIKSYGTIVIESGDLEEKIYEISEDKMSNGILKVTRTGKKTIYFVSGHGEKSIESTEPGGVNKLKEAILEENYIVKELLTLREQSIPIDCEILVIAGAEKDLFPAESTVIADYLSSGGNLLVLLEPILDLPSLYRMINRYGIDIGDNVIIDRFGRVLAGNFLTPVVNQYGRHPITEGFKYASFFPQARSVGPVADPPEGVTVTPLASTGESAYAESNIDMILNEGQTQFEGEYDMAGPVDLAVVATSTIDTTGFGQRTVRGDASRLVVFGDSDFASNSYLELGGNKDLIMNTISWLAEEKDLIAIRPKDTISQPIILTARQGRMVFWLPFIGVPSLVGAIGIAIAVKKRRSS